MKSFGIKTLKIVVHYHGQLTSLKNSRTLNFENNKKRINIKVSVSRKGSYLDTKALIGLLKERGIKVSKSSFYRILKKLQSEGIISKAVMQGREVYLIPEENIEEVIKRIKKERKENFLSILEIQLLLEKRGFKISHSSLYRIMKNAPKDFIVQERKLKKTYYYFKPEIMEYIIKQLSK